MVDAVGIQQKLEGVRQEVAEACARANRDASTVRIVAVTKSASVSVLEPLSAAGISDFAENRWPDAKPKVEAESARPVDARPIWHFIGRLQVNKVKYVVPHFDWIHSLDNWALAEAINNRAGRLNRSMRCLVQVNVSGEATKAGLSPESLLDFLIALRELPHLSVRGLMTMAPQTEDVEQVRPVFRQLRQLLEVARPRLPANDLQELSMGMSNDFAVAVEEGATMVRVGRRLVGGFASEPPGESQPPECSPG